MDIKGSCDIYNLGNNHPEKLLNLIHLIEQELGKEAKKVFLPMQPGDVRATFADIDLSKQILNFAPKVTLQDGIKKFVEWYRNHPDLIFSHL